MHSLSRAVATAIVALAVVAPAASAQTRGGLIGTTAHSRHFHARRHRRAAAPAQSIARTGMAVGVGGGLKDCGQTPEPDMQTVRVILYQDEPLQTFYACAQQATQTGAHLIVSVQYNPAWTITQDRAWFQSAINLYGPLHPYAMSVGNEEELWGSSTSGYVHVWNTVEPMIAQQLPATIRIAGEISPWGLHDLELEAQTGLRGAQVFAGHAYPDGDRGFNPAALAGIARIFHVQPWVTEGMCGPNAWMTYGCVSRQQLQADRISLGVDWYVSDQPTSPPSGTIAS